MGVNDLGYRGWSGSSMPAWTTALVIASTGVRRAWTIRWLRRLVGLSWLPATYYAAGFFMAERVLINPNWRDGLPFINNWLSESSEAFKLLNSPAMDDTAMARHLIWSWLLLTFLRYSQSVIMVLAVGLIAPPLISQDIRSRAFLLYFSRPLARTDYILGKLGTIWFYLAVISMLPALVLYLLGVFLSPSISVVTATYDLPIRIVAASAVLSVPTATYALCLSSMSQESRFAGFGWFATWAIGWVTYLMFLSTQSFESDGRNIDPSKWANVSPYHILERVQRWVFGFLDFSQVRSSAFILLLVTLCAAIILHQRVSAPMRQ